MGRPFYIGPLTLLQSGYQDKYIQFEGAYTTNNQTYKDLLGDHYETYRFDRKPQGYCRRIFLLAQAHKWFGLGVTVTRTEMDRMIYPVCGFNFSKDDLIEAIELETSIKKIENRGKRKTKAAEKKIASVVA